jgi:hypothetical protein
MNVAFAEILRDIARGGFAGAITGVVVAGVGGRIAMRLAALLVPQATGSSTENGFRIGDITLGGSLGLVFFGLLVGLLVGMLWVIISPWIPSSGVRRALLAIPIGVALGTNGLVDGENQDFLILRHNVVVVVVLIALVALIGFAVPLVDEWLDRHLPHAASNESGIARLYAVIAGIGAVLTIPLAVSGFFTAQAPLTLVSSLALVAVALCTLRWWTVRLRGTTVPTPRLATIARVALVLAVIFGFGATLPEVAGALGAT